MYNELIREIILSQKDFDKLPRDKHGICYYDDNLYCDYNELKELPKDLVVKGSLYCNNNHLKKLPNNLVVSDNLYCSKNELTTLPKGLVVGSSLWCSNNELKELPNNLKVGGNLYCKFNRITKEIKSEISGKIYMDEEQQKIYDRVIKINKLKEIIHE